MISQGYCRLTAPIKFFAFLVAFVLMAEPCLASNDISDNLFGTWTSVDKSTILVPEDMKFTPDEFITPWSHKRHKVHYIMGKNMAIILPYNKESRMCVLKNNKLYCMLVYGISYDDYDYMMTHHHKPRKTFPQFLGVFVKVAPCDDDVSYNDSFFTFSNYSKSSNSKQCNPKKIVVKLHTKEQFTRAELFAYNGNTLDHYYHPLIGRAGHETTPGHYHILRKDKTHVSRAYKSPMPYALFFSSDGMAIHEAEYWNFGRRIVRWGSHGCLGLNEEEAKEMYDWTPVGTPVEIDP